ncbi:hypothetical protein WP3W19E03_22720 [Aeromonas veronii]|uniref:Uncharacterized protein n=1 Tax=Aeromonas veronii TaxID=654 RepID=A0A6S5BRU3_AERVE|nr:hypothetical protein WP3W19E03_22720 [Aeromonas veronii]
MVNASNWRFPLPGNNDARGGEWKKYLKFPGQALPSPNHQGVKFI